MNFMLDIETLDTRSTAVILSVGIVPFTRDQVLASEAVEFRLNMEEQVELGRAINPRTIAWWMQQADEVRLPLFSSVTDQTLVETLTEINRYYFKLCERFYENPDFYDSEAIKVWSNGPTFDMKILENLYEQLNMRPAYHYRSPRCQRTIEDMHGKDVPKKDASRDQLHNAKWDAICQAQRVVDICLAKGLVI